MDPEASGGWHQTAIGTVGRFGTGARDPTGEPRASAMAFG